MTDVIDAAVPGDDAIARLLPRPGSILRRRASDPRALAGAGGYALTLQVAHPTIAGGVRDFSSYASDPWGRAFRTADYVLLLSYGSPATVGRLARSLRASHRSYRGTDHNGNRYSALEPSAYAWVHATIGMGIVRGHDLMGSTFQPDEREEFWQQWLALGDVLGVERAELPAHWTQIDDYSRHMIDDVLEYNDVMDDLLAKTYRAVGGTPFRWLPERVFAAVGWPYGHLGRFLGSGMLGADLRVRFRLPWSKRAERLFTAYCGASKATTPLLPRWAKEPGPFVLWMRSREDGPFGQSNADLRCPA